MEADEMESWARDKRGQALHELLGDITTWVAGALELQHDIAGLSVSRSLAMSGRVM